MTNAEHLLRLNVSKKAGKEIMLYNYYLMKNLILFTIFLLMGCNEKKYRIELHILHMKDSIRTGGEGHMFHDMTKIEDNVYSGKRLGDSIVFRIVEQKKEKVRF